MHLSNTNLQTRALLIGAFLLGLVASHLVQADQVEIVPLRHRTVEQVLPVLRQIVEPGGAVTGMEGQIILRASPANLMQLKQVLATIDTPPRRLMIFVSQDRDASVVYDGGGASGSVGIDDRGVRGRVDIDVQSGRMDRERVVTQQVQALDGTRAFIRIGQSVPMRARTVTPTPHGPVVTESTVMREASTGFTVLPRVSGERVTLEINPRMDELEDRRGPSRTISTQSVNATVNGRLGEWLELALSDAQTTHSDRGILSAGSAQLSAGSAQLSAGSAQLSAGATSQLERRRVWVKVEEIR